MNKHDIIKLTQVQKAKYAKMNISSNVKQKNLSVLVHCVFLWGSSFPLNCLKQALSET